MNSAATLLIEDNEAFAMGLQRRLGRESLGMDWAANWEDGFAEFRVGGHELVVADYNLPGSEHGLKLLARVKALSPGTRLVLISGALLPEAEELVERSGLVDRYLVKGAGITDELTIEARNAAERAKRPTDWPAVAHAILREREIDYSDVDAIDAVLRRQVDET